MTARVILMIWLLVVAIALSAAQSMGQKDDPEEKQWRKAILTGTIDALDSYLRKYPKGKHTERIKIHREELASDSTRRLKDNVISDDVLTHGPGERFKIEVKALAPNYALCRGITSPFRGRVQFEPASRGPSAGTELVFSDLLLIAWPPELVKTDRYAGISSCTIGKGETYVGGCLGRTFEGEGFLFLLNFGADPVAKMPIKGSIPPMASGSVHIYKGDVELFGLIFKGDDNDPLRFIIDNVGDYVLIGGRGSIYTGDGKEIFSTKK